MAAASERIHQLAKRAKRAGHPATLDQIKADVMVGLLDGRFHGKSTAQIVTNLLTAAGEPPAATAGEPPAATAGEPAVSDADAYPDRRFPTAALRRHIQQRDRTCKGPGCRRPATRTDYDHTWDHQYGGPTTSTNGGAFCPHDHLLKTKAGWRLYQPQPGQFVWYTPLGQIHRTRGEPMTDPDPPPF